MKFETFGPVRDACSVLALLILILFGAPESYGDEALPRTFTNSLHGFRISFPQDWDRAPPERLDAANETARAQHPEWKHPALHYAYQMTNDAGAFPAGVVIRVADKPSDRKAVLADIEANDLPRGVQLGHPVFDDELNVYQVDYHGQAGGVSFDAWVAEFLTKESVIKMFFVYPTNEPQLGAVVKGIVKNVRISDDIRIPSQHPMQGGLIIALVGVAVIVLALSRPKREKAPDSPCVGCG